MSEAKKRSIERVKKSLVSLEQILRKEAAGKVPDGVIVWELAEAPNRRHTVCRMFKQVVQQGRSKRCGESYTRTLSLGAKRERSWRPVSTSC
jgi:hypothetical protein